MLTHSDPTAHAYLLGLLLFFCLAFFPDVFLDTCPFLLLLFDFGLDHADDGSLMLQIEFVGAEKVPNKFWQICPFGYFNQILLSPDVDGDLKFYLLLHTLPMLNIVYRLPEYHITIVASKDNSIKIFWIISSIGVAILRGQVET